MRPRVAVTAVMMLLLLALLSAMASAAYNPFGFVAVPLGDSTTEEQKGNYGQPYTVGLYRIWDQDDGLISDPADWSSARETHQEEIGFTYGPNIVSLVPNDHWVKVTFTPYNLYGSGHTARILWGSTFGLDEYLTRAGYFRPEDERPRPMARRRYARNELADPGFEADCIRSGPSFIAWIPTNDIAPNQTTHLMMEVWGPKGKKSTKWLFFTVVKTKRGALQEPLGVAKFTAPMEWVTTATAEEILRACVGLESPRLPEPEADQTSFPPPTTDKLSEAKQTKPQARGPDYVTHDELSEALDEQRQLIVVDVKQLLEEALDGPQQEAPTPPVKAPPTAAPTVELKLAAGRVKALLKPLPEGYEMRYSICHDGQWGEEQGVPRETTEDGVVVFCSVEDIPVGHYTFLVEILDPAGEVVNTAQKSFTLEKG